MIITRKINLDFARSALPQPIRAVQGDSYTRAVEVTLYENGVPWPVPAGASVLVRYRKPDNTGGLYDTLPNGDAACTVTSNVILAILAPQMMAVAGAVKAQLEIILGSEVLATFGFVVLVEADPSSGAALSEDYFNWNQWAEQALENVTQRAEDAADEAAQFAEAADQSRVLAAEYADAVNKDAQAAEDAAAAAKLSEQSAAKDAQSAADASAAAQSDAQLAQESKIASGQSADEAKQAAAEALASAQNAEQAVEDALTKAKESGEFDGPTGATPNITVGMVDTLPAGSDAAATITGTAENPVLNLAIPKGADGAGISDDEVDALAKMVE